MKSILIGLLLALILAVPAQGKSWKYELGPELPGYYFSVGPYLSGLGIPIGEYGGGGLALIDPLSASWQCWADLPVGPGHESISVIQNIHSGPMGVNVWTENCRGAQCWTAWQEQDWKWQRSQSFAPWPWALAGPSAANQGWVSLGEGRPSRQSGAWLAAWDQDRWKPLTPTIPDVIIWDAVSWRDGLLLGCSMGDGRYLDEWAGRLVLVQGQEWRLVNLPAMAGVIRLSRLDAWPGRLWISTAWGEVWWTDDLDQFTLWHRQDYGYQCNAYLHQFGDSLVVADARGKVWFYADPEASAELVLHIPGTEFMSLTPVDLPDNGWCLAGPLTMHGAAASRPVVITPK